MIINVLWCQWFISTSVGIINNCIKGLIGPLPEKHSCWMSNNNNKYNIDFSQFCYVIMIK